MSKRKTVATNSLRRSPVEMLGIAVVIGLLSYVIVPLTAGAKSQDLATDRATALSVAAMQNQTLPYGQLPAAGLRGGFYTLAVTATAYNSVPGQTDATPFITANGSHVHVGTVAANFLPFGTQVTFPDLYGDQVFVVEDRMNPRYPQNVDIWMDGVSEAKQFGRRHVVMQVYTNK